MTMALPWRIDYDASDAHPGASLAFGSFASHLLMTAMPVIDTPDQRNGDVPAPLRDTTYFGQDFLGASNITFALEVDTKSETEARAILDTFKGAWRGDAVRLEDGALAMLTAHTGRVTFGRPRRSPADTKRTFQGRAGISAEFLAADDLWYDDVSQIVTSLVPALGGGVVAPVVAPVVAVGQSTDRSRTFDVLGQFATPTWAEITGPIINPVIEVPGRFRYGFATTLAYDERIDIDVRTGTILRNGTTTMSTDASSSLLDAGALPPGHYSFTLRGTSTSGSPSARLSWRNAHPTW